MIRFFFCLFPVNRKNWSMKLKRKQAKWHGKRKWQILRESKCGSILHFQHSVGTGQNVLLFTTFILLLISLIQRLEGKSKDISKIAADITQNVSLRQGMERKKVIQHIRGLYKTDLSASRHWQELVQQLTHDRWVIFCTHSSWSP